MRTNKTKLTKALFGLVVIITFIACEKNSDKDNYFKVNSFKAIPQADTAPTKVFVIYENTSSGFNSYTFIHEGAYDALENGNAINTASWESASDNEKSQTDTITLYYLNPGNYTVSMQVNSETYSDSFILK